MSDPAPAPLDELADRAAALPGGLVRPAPTDERGAPVADPAAPNALVLEAVFEALALHFGAAAASEAAAPMAPRVLGREGDADLDLLVGDRLYALGLAELAARDDVAAVRELATLIARSARAAAAGDERARAAAWSDGARRVSGAGA